MTPTERWEIDGQFDDESDVAIVVQGDGDFICEVSPLIDEWDEQQIARVKLMAAAPDLPEACVTVKRFLDDLENGGDEGDPLRAIRRRVHAALRIKLEPVIAKAEGRL
jgi:hypothetical protein